MKKSIDEIRCGNIQRSFIQCGQVGREGVYSRAGVEVLSNTWSCDWLTSSIQKHIFFTLVLGVIRFY